MTLCPVVTDVDRRWALAQCPVWASRGPLDRRPKEPEGEIVDHTAEAPSREPERALNWDMFVADQIERFEKYFVAERKSAADWSRLWRKVWWPKADPSILHPKLVPRAHNPHPVFRKGDANFDLALSLGNESERMIWRKLGFAQFKPDDPRLAKFKAKAPAPVIRNPAGEG